MKSKRFFAVMMAIIMVLTMMAGCGSQPSTPAPAPSGGGDPAPAEIYGKVLIYTTMY